MQTEAIVFVGINRVEVRSLAMPDPEPGEVQIRTRFSTISGGTEGWALRNEFTWSATRYPSVPGYQRMGIIESLGEGVTGWQVGDRVMATRGQWGGAITPFWGSHTALGNTPATELYRIPDNVEDIDASGAVVAQVGYNAASRAGIQPGDWAVVYGDGLIGQCAAQAIRARGARVILVGHRPERLKRAADYSADFVINNHSKNVVEAVHELTGGQPVPVILDSVQTENSQHEYVPLLERGIGQIVYCGFTPGTTWADMGLLQQRELTAHFISGWTRPRMEATLDLMAAGKMRLTPLITHLVPYKRGPEMYQINNDKSTSFLGITLDWTGN
jgi:2-desacetyl-2-hydroxyethyl bacteriochlorophyllide A dehydrogenase